MSGVDLDDTTRCPVGAMCESCGTADRKLTVVTASTSVGIVCLTLCARCGISGQTPRMSAGTAVRFVGAHCDHLQITVDEMAEILESDR